MELAPRTLEAEGRIAAAYAGGLHLFEPHADVIVKGSRDAEYDHKLNLVTGRSGLILDAVIETGNPADSERFLPMLERHIAYGEAPRQAAADGGFASRHDLRQAKARGVRDVAFHKKAGLRIEDMVKSRWIYRKLRNFRAGIEAGIRRLQSRTFRPTQTYLTSQPPHPSQKQVSHDQTSFDVHQY
jgi:IS5 family transposase